MTGDLTSRDLRRLEQLCGPALEQKALPLTLRLTASSRVDPLAQEYLDRLVQRGALLVLD